VQLPLFYQGVGPRERKRRGEEHLAMVNLENRAHHMPGQLSGGERQRTAIARALVTEPGFVLADEPTGNLDSRSGQEIMAIFDRLHAMGKTLIVITHDPSIADRIPRIVQIADGRLSEGRR
jgi:putative ABC transport system ATP-binding protein